MFAHRVIRDIAIALACLFISACIGIAQNDLPGQLPADQTGNVTSEATHSVVATQSELSVLLTQCKSLCWAGIVSGKTAKQEAIAMLEARYGETNVEIKPNVVQWVSNNVDISEGGSVSLVDDIVDDVYVWFLEQRLTMKDLVQLSREPELIITTKAISSEGGCAGTSLFYSTEGIVVSLYPVNGFVGVYETQSIYSLQFLSPRLASYWNPTDATIEEWDGYRDYCVK